MEILHKIIKLLKHNNKTFDIKLYESARHAERFYAHELVHYYEHYKQEHRSYYGFKH